MKLFAPALRALPKVDLHCHLDGSVRTSTLFDIMKNKTKLPCDTAAEMRKYVEAPSTCRSLTEFLNKFEFFYPYLKSPQVMERIAYELCEDASSENIRYLEVRFAPCLQTGGVVVQEDIVKAVLEGLSKGSRDFNIKTGAILCIYRGTDPSQWEETYRLGEKYISSGVVGFDLAGDESRFSGENFKDLFKKAFSALIPVTIHAGEAAGWESVKEAVDFLHAQRIGHGVRIFENGFFLDRIKQMKIPLEICITSNVQTGVFKDYSFHPVADFYRRGLRVTLNTDDRSVSGIDLTHEWKIVQQECGLEIEDVLDMNMNSIEAAFCDANTKKLLKEEIQKETRRIMEKVSAQKPQAR
ncbi:MAG: adenosine deaminase [Elusimicrobia bacterium CG08_land_8_20_14_0_20_44_26]|nr:MAG: adenosine deaminase [Elusimicrobia bacterium CG08_land_8_20_14_0_20_44_26]